MITVLTGSNSFEIAEALKALGASFDGPVERIDGAALELRDIPDLLMGTTLFGEKRLVVIRELSESRTVWEKLPEWLPRISDDIHLVLIEEKMDKRTLTYKALKQAADVHELNAWTDRDRALAEDWVVKRAAQQKMKLDKKVAHLLVERVGVDQWQLANAIEKLMLVDTIDAETVEWLIEANSTENVFQLFETALEGNMGKVHEVLRTLELTEDPYQLFALLSSQAFQLAAVATAEEGSSPEKDFAIHPFVASKLARHGRKLSKTGALRVLKAFARADADMKRSKAEPWVLIERVLLEVSI